jgi:hypothetical protein
MNWYGCPFCFVKVGGGTMDFLSQLLRGIAFVPALVNGIESLFGSKSGAEKKDAAMSFLQNALSMADAVAAREIVDPEKFRAGISEIINGTVMCLNASSWNKQSQTANSSASSQPA